MKEKEKKERRGRRRRRKKKKQGEKEVLQFYIYKLPIDRPAAVTGINNIKNRGYSESLNNRGSRNYRGTVFLGGRNYRRGVVIIDAPTFLLGMRNVSTCYHQNQC